MHPHSIPPPPPSPLSFTQVSPPNPVPSGGPRRAGGGSHRLTAVVGDIWIFRFALPRGAEIDSDPGAEIGSGDRLGSGGDRLGSCGDRLGSVAQEIGGRTPGRSRRLPMARPTRGPSALHSVTPPRSLRREWRERDRPSDRILRVTFPSHLSGSAIPARDMIRLIRVTYPSHGMGPPEPAGAAGRTASPGTAIRVIRATYPSHPNHLSESSESPIRVIRATYPSHLSSDRPGPRQRIGADSACAPRKPAPSVEACARHYPGIVCTKRAQTGMRWD